MKDLRDPAALGEKLLQTARAARGVWGAIPLSEIWDVHVRHLAHPDYDRNPSPVEKYGDPVISHRERIAAGLEVELP